MKHCKTPYIIYAVALLAIFAANKLALFKPYLGVIIAVLFLYVPVIFLFIKKQQPAFYGISKKGLLKSIARALLLSFLIFPLYAIGFYIYMRHFYGIKTLSFSILPMHILIFALNDLLMVAIPEEVFYRGYLQSELRQCDKKKVNVFGARIGFSFLMVNVLFAAGHLIVIQDISRLAMFFPGLVFSWLREKDDNISGAVLFHWLSNVLSFILLR